MQMAKRTSTANKKKPPKEWFPKGWDQKRVQAVLDHYENQTEDEELAEYEAAMALEDQTMILVPKKLVPEIRKLIARRSKRAS